MPMIKTVAKIGFRHEGRYLQPGETVELPSVDARALVARGKVTVQEEKQEKAEKKKAAKREYARRDMEAEHRVELTPEPVSSAPAPAPAPRTSYTSRSVVEESKGEE